MFEVLEIGGATIHADTRSRSPRHTQLPQAIEDLSTKRLAPAANPSDEGQSTSDAQIRSALVGTLQMETRRFIDLMRAHQRLDLQTKAMCRYACNGDTKAGQALHTRVMKGAADPVALDVAGWLIPYFDAMAPLAKAITAQEKVIAKGARQLPVWPWAQSIAGLSDRYLGLIVGECGAPVGEFKSVSAVWKRMGLAVIGESRQRRVKGDAAIEHGYVARRAALMWNIGDSILKQQVRSEKDEAGKKLDGSSFAIGDLGQIYLDRKAYELGRGIAEMTPMWAHNRAKRYMEKRLLRELWKTWRRAG